MAVLINWYWFPHFPWLCSTLFKFPSYLLWSCKSTGGSWLFLHDNMTFHLHTAVYFCIVLHLQQTSWGLKPLLRVTLVFGQQILHFARLTGMKVKFVHVQRFNELTWHLWEWFDTEVMIYLSHSFHWQCQTTSESQMEVNLTNFFKSLFLINFFCLGSTSDTYRHVLSDKKDSCHSVYCPGEAMFACHKYRKEK